jgi:hypothetical protein
MGTAGLRGLMEIESFELQAALLVPFVTTTVKVCTFSKPCRRLAGISHLHV